MSDRSIQVKAGNPFQARENSRVLRILIADRDTNCRKRVKALLTEEPDSEIVAECSQTDQILSALREYKPDLLLFDLSDGASTQADEEKTVTNTTARATRRKDPDLFLNMDFRFP